MSTYTPTSSEVRDAYQSTGDGLDFKRRYFERGDEFDRWLASVERVAAAQALSDQSVKARWQAQDALAILNETIAYWGESTSTHSKECWKSHPSCLAVKVKSALEGIPDVGE